AKLRPDCILACESDNRPEQIRELKKRFPVRSFAVRSIPAVLDTIHDLGRFMQKPEEARAIKNKILLEQDKSRQAAEGKNPVPTLVLIWNQPFLTVNFDTYISRLIEASGGYNVFHSDPLPEFPVELEDMIEKGPQLLLLPSVPFPFKKSHIAYFRKYRIFSSIPIEIVKGDLFSRFGPKTVEALRILRSLIAEKAIPGVVE
ncbi:MAG TPA: helical backbone metal receptor, partial [bacterium]|nr:helical backbone metal receptor [bacterium]